MIRKYIFSEELGRNIIWVMLSGFFLKIGAKENLFGQIIMPDDHYLFNLDDNQIDKNYLDYKNLHYIFFDGSTEFLNDDRFKNIKKKVNIYYVGQIPGFWENIKNCQPLFSDNINDLDRNIIEIKKKYPIFFKKYFLKIFLTSLVNFKKPKLAINHIFGKKKYVYYGYIKPTKKHLEIYQKYLRTDKYNYIIFFEKSKNIQDLKYKINQLCFMKNNLLNDIDQKYYPYINEFILFMIRNIICNILLSKENFLIYDGLGGNYNFNAYEMFFGNHHTYLDLGSKVGFDKIYPRQALLKLFKRNIISFNLTEDFFLHNKNDSEEKLFNSIIEFLNKLNIKI